ncbi:universal stress protein [Halobacteriales archaeon QS_4_66_20]|nr:MAG: universal stress protein [Halobacteriales archaeon QS_4_66_20]
MAVLAAIGEERRSNRVLAVAADLAGAHGERLDVLHVVPEGEFETHKAAIEEFSFAQEEQSAATFAEKVAEETLDDTADVSGVGRVGDPVEQTISVLEETDPRYLVIGGRRRSPAGKAVFGSRTQDILLRSPIPVMTVIQDE